MSSLMNLRHKDQSFDDIVEDTAKELLSTIIGVFAILGMLVILGGLSVGPF